MGEGGEALERSQLCAAKARNMPLPRLSRREFLVRSAVACGGALAAGTLPAAVADSPLFRISIAQWSFHRALFSGRMDHLDFAGIARDEYGIDGVEYCSIFFPDKAQSADYLAEMKSRAADHDVNSLLIMIDREGPLGDPSAAKRAEAVDNHKKWVQAAAELGCHSIRVNAQTGGSYEEQIGYAADGLRQLCEFADGHGVNVIVENHGGNSSNGKWLAEVMRRIDHPRSGTLPDFGNFRIEPDVWYDRYEGVAELMPFAKAVSAKTHDFDADGNDTKTDYLRMMQIVLDRGYRGYVGIEYEGRDPDERAGVRRSQELLLRVRKELAGRYV